VNQLRHQAPAKLLVICLDGFHGYGWFVFPLPCRPKWAEKSPSGTAPEGQKNREYDQAPLGACLTTDTDTTDAATAEARSELFRKIVVPDKFIGSPKQSQGAAPLSRP
jgi:hypothetical protein